jgi:hypothetical protein
MACLYLPRVMYGSPLSSIAQVNTVTGVDDVHDLVRPSDFAVNPGHPENPPLRLTLRDPSRLLPFAFEVPRGVLL